MDVQQLVDATMTWYRTEKLPKPEVVIAPNPLYAAFGAVVAANLDGPFSPTDKVMEAVNRNEETKAAYEWAKLAASHTRLTHDRRRHPRGGGQTLNTETRTPNLTRLLPLYLARIFDEQSAWRLMRDVGLYGLEGDGNAIFCYSKVVIVSEPALSIKYDFRGRPHCETGPAAVWKTAKVDRGQIVETEDTWGIWAWSGRLATEEIVLGEQTLEKVLGESNNEIRQIRVERFGMENIAGAPGAKIINEDTDGSNLPRRLISIPLPGANNWDQDANIVILQVTNPVANEKVFLRVPPTMRTCSEACAWTYGYEGANVKNYSPTLER